MGVQAAQLHWHDALILAFWKYPLGGLAQLVRAHAWHAWGHWFDSSISHHSLTHPRYRPENREWHKFSLFDRSIGTVFLWHSNRWIPTFRQTIKTDASKAVRMPGNLFGILIGLLDCFTQFVATKRVMLKISILCSRGLFRGPPNQFCLQLRVIWMRWFENLYCLVFNLTLLGFL